MSIKNSVDVVYIWCDGSDEKWRKKRSMTCGKVKEKDFLERYSNVEGRFRDNGELRYSLRSLEKYFPDHGRVFIITDRQIPDYLRLDKGIQFIFHDEFLSSGSIPTFSSKAIESRIPFISDISENFIYLNDDVFLGPSFSLEYLYETGRAKYYFFPGSVRPIPELINQSMLASTILGYPGLDSLQSAHTPRYINKQHYMKMCAEYPVELEKTQNERFRDSRYFSFLSDFYPRWLIMKGLADAIILADDCSTGSSEGDYHSIFSQFSTLPFFGINDTSDDAKNNHPDLQKIGITLKELFPEKSTFEK